MDTKKLQEILGWCSAINFGILMFTGLMFLIMQDWMYDFYQNLFTFSKESFYVVMLSSIALYKALVFVFNIIPYFALRIINKK